MRKTHRTGSTPLLAAQSFLAGYNGQISLGHGAFYAVGAYMYALLASPHLMSNFAWMAATFPDGL